MSEVRYDIENQPENPKISKVPTHVKERNLAAYEPKVVSIGPYHHGKPPFVSMERHKQRVRDKFIDGSELTLQDYEAEIRKVVKTLKMSYADLDNLMILDGCFLIEFLSGPSNFHKHFPTNDPIFSAHGHAINNSAVMQDLLMVENQIPYLAIKTLWLTSGKEIEREVTADSDVISDVISQWIRSGVKEPGFHMLDTHMVGLLKMGERSMQDKEVRKRCAFELYQSNVQFKKTACYNNMHFDKETGILTLPSIIINERTSTTYLNMVARALTWTTSTTAEFAIYARLMGTLVQSAKDVRLLQYYGIIVNELSNHEAVVDVIQEIARGTTVSDNVKNNDGLSYRSILLDLNEFCQRRVIRLRKVLYLWFSNLWETHFKTPWSGISLIAAIALMTLTGVQTAYAILSYKKGQ
ncbi:hypothetical protein MKW94_018162 [Papaver nudicaule]|uniref:Uncharacterized protein n=1 Tax=Papaver nudicaule TaxID=74823 RepID=A0AA41VPX4_PAPNU|nr:hypothetical protein [Papaver nudicaule]